MAPSKDNYLVIGGSGFVGRHIVQQLLDRGDTVSVLDIVQRYHDVPFYSADISDQEQVASALRKVCFLLLVLYISSCVLLERRDVYHPYCFPSCWIERPSVVLESKRGRNKSRRSSRSAMRREEAGVYELCWGGV